MRKQYTKPSMEVEVYELNTDIAANCGDVISLGPEAPGKDVCSEFDDAWDVEIALFTTKANTPFYNDGSANCDCYYTSGGSTYFTS